MADDEIRILASPEAAENIQRALSRRRFLGVSAGAAGLALGGASLLAACGDDSGGTDAGGDTSTTASGGGDVAAGSGKLNLYTWAEYHSEDNLKAFGNVNVTVFNSNEEAVAKLEAAKGTAGFDLMCPTGGFIPQLASKDLIVKLDKSKLKNFENLDPLYRDQIWDKGNEYSVCKDWGTTGWIYDNTVITTPITTWSDFIEAAKGVASGKTSVLDTPADLCGIYFWANGIVWTTEKAEDLDACEKFIVDELAQHVKAFDSYPGINLTQGNYVLSQVWNGDARQGLISVEDAGDDPKKYTWGIGAPKTEIFMDNYAIVKGGNADNAYAFIDFMLVPENSVRDLEFHGYNTGIKGVKDLVPADLKYPEMIFFDDAQVKNMEGGLVNSAQDRLVDIYNKAKAKAGS